MTEENSLQDLPENPEIDIPESSNKVVGIDEQMRTAYLDYAMSVIVARAIPDCILNTAAASSTRKDMGSPQHSIIRPYRR